MKLSAANLKSLAEKLPVPHYYRDNSDQRILHFGVGGFHRSHQAVYTHQTLQSNDRENWSICGVGIMPSDERMNDALRTQDYLYSVIEFDPEKAPAVRIIGAITDYIYAPNNPAAVFKKLTSPELRIVSMTITEGGYFLDAASGLPNIDNDIIHYDLNHPNKPKTVFGYIVEALAQRKERNLPGFTILSCDNLQHNGDICRNCILQFAAHRSAEFVEWVDTHVSFPNSMVDRITPVTSAPQKLWLTQQYGIQDQWPVVCESYIQWVIEDNFCRGRPAWEEFGAQFTQDVTPYENTKLYLLNGSHSALAYLAALANYRYTHEAIEDPAFNNFITQFMDDDVSPLLTTPKTFDITQYKKTLIYRLSNHNCGDQISRLCAEGSSKLPKFLIPTFEKLIQTERPINRAALIIASWMYFLAHTNEQSIEDINQVDLRQAAIGPDPVRTLLNMKTIFGETLSNSQIFYQAVLAAYQQLSQQDLHAVIQSLTQQQN